MKFNTVIIGNIAHDINTFYSEDRKIINETKNIGGACFYSAIPASLFGRVGIVGKVGDDFNVSVFNSYDIDTGGLKVVDGELTISFHQHYIGDDPKNRIVDENINPKMFISIEDIPKSYLNARYIHIATNEPGIQLELVKYLKSHSRAIISIDTIKGYSGDKKTKEAFNLADIAFIDSDFKELLDCKANTKIIKGGKNGCYYKGLDKEFFVDVNEVPVVEKTGAGDCMNGVFINLLSLGYIPEEALQKATEVATVSVTDYGIEHVASKSIHI